MDLKRGRTRVAPTLHVLGTGTRVPVSIPVTRVPVTYLGAAQYVRLYFLKSWDRWKFKFGIHVSCSLRLLKVPPVDINNNRVVEGQRTKYIYRLVHLALKYLGISATFVPSERLFSRTGEIVSRRRASQKPTSVDIVFLSKTITLLTAEWLAWFGVGLSRKARKLCVLSSVLTSVLLLKRH